MQKKDHNLTAKIQIPDKEYQDKADIYQALDNTYDNIMASMGDKGFVKDIDAGEINENDLSRDAEINNDTIAKNLYKDSSELKTENTPSEEDSFSNNTIIHNIIKEDQNDPDTAVPCPRILGGQVYTSNRPSGMARSTMLGLTFNTTPEQTSTASKTSLISTTRLKEFCEEINELRNVLT